jgi:hypothetical protein
LTVERFAYNTIHIGCYCCMVEWTFSLQRLFSVPTTASHFCVWFKFLIFFCLSQPLQTSTSGHPTHKEKWVLIEVLVEWMVYDGSWKFFSKVRECFDVCGSIHHSTIHKEKSNKIKQWVNSVTPAVIIIWSVLRTFNSILIDKYPVMLTFVWW